MTDYTRKYGPAAIGARLRRLSERIDQDAGRIYADLGLEFEQRWVGVMEHLAERGGASVTELASALGISHPSVSQTRLSLAKAGLIIASADPEDGRSRRLALSAKGRRLYSRLRPLWQVLDAVAAEINSEAGDVITSLDRLDAALARDSLYDRINRKLA